MFGVGARAPGGGAQAVPAREPGLDQRRVPPVPAGGGGDGQLGAVGGQHRAELGLGQGQGALVLADGGVEQLQVRPGAGQPGCQRQGRPGLRVGERARKQRAPLSKV